jgi:hypothetical protein
VEHTARYSACSSSIALHSTTLEPWSRHIWVRTNTRAFGVYFSLVLKCTKCRQSKQVLLLFVESLYVEPIQVQCRHCDSCCENVGNHRQMRSQGWYELRQCVHLKTPSNSCCRPSEIPETQLTWQLDLPHLKPPECESECE